MTFHVPDKFRIRTGAMGSTEEDGNNGAFRVALKRGQFMNVIASDGMGWEHVSVSRTDRCPTWDEMCEVKDLFWGEDDVVIQYHPAKKDYINNHHFCLHLWRPIGVTLPAPDSLLVGL